MKIGIIGCGNIFRQYAEHSKPYAGLLTVAACADLDADRARSMAEEYGVPRGGSVDELLGDPEIGLVINLTVPAVHAKVNRQILEAGKHAYTEKPFALDVAEGKRVLDLAKEKGLQVGCAPDTFLGGGAQTVLGALRAGKIGRPRHVEILRTSSGPYHWHPNPAFFAAVGGGPLYDVGPYDLTGLVTFFGPIQSVAAMADKCGETLTVPAGPAEGQTFPVEVFTHVNSLLRTESGVDVSMVHSFDAPWGAESFIVHGEEGTMRVPDLNHFKGEIKVRAKYSKDDWEVIPHTHNTEVGRGIGVADMVKGIRAGRPYRATGAQGLHVLDVMETIIRAAEAGRTLEVANRCEQPAPLQPGLKLGEMD